MASTFSARVSLSILANEIINDGISKGTLPAGIKEDLSLEQGTSDGQINQAYAKRESGIAASTTTVYDLIGSLTDKSGGTLNFDEVVLIVIRNRSTDTVDHLLVGPDATNGFGVVTSNRGFWAASGDRSVVSADSWSVFYCKEGVPAVGGSSDELAVITPSGSAANTWDILILGRDNP